MSSKPGKIRKRVWESANAPSSRDIAECLRDVDEALIAQEPVAVPDEVVQVYQPPFFIAFPRNPKTVKLGRIRLDKDPAIVVGSGMVHWDWTGDGIKVNAIDGLTSGTRYLMTFEVVG